MVGCIGCGEVRSTPLREVDDSWPAVAAKLHPSAGLWPLVLDARTETLQLESGCAPRLPARGWPAGEAAAVDHLIPSGGDTLVEIRQDAVMRPAGWFQRHGARTGSSGATSSPSVGWLVDEGRQPMPGEVYDAVVIGAGPNGLVAANRLIDAGWSVLVLEAQPDVGGAVRSDRSVHDDYVHDTFSAFYPLAAASPAVKAFRLDEHGLRWRHAPAVVGHPRRDGP